MGEFLVHVLEYLEWAERHESNVWYAEDYRQAWITLRFAERGLPHPFTSASYVMYGLHPDRLWPAIVERRRVKLGSLFSQFFPAIDSPVLLPKKPPQSELERENKYVRRSIS